MRSKAHSEIWSKGWKKNERKAKIISTMKELIFLVEEAPEGGYTARALDTPIYTEGEDMADLREHVLDAVRCHYEEGETPSLIRLHYVKDEVLAV